jgi:hypothetical protein
MQIVSYITPSILYFIIQTVCSWVMEIKIVISQIPFVTYTITYIARASSAGEFRVLPVTAKEFYLPDISGRSAGSVFTVKP